MNLSFIGIIVALFFLFYNIYCYILKKVIYTINNNKLVVNNSKFYNIQLILNIVNAFALIVISYFAYLNKLSFQLYAIYFIGLFWFFNFFIRYISIKLKYIYYKE